MVVTPSTLSISTSLIVIVIESPVFLFLVELISIFVGALPSELPTVVVSVWVVAAQPSPSRDTLCDKTLDEASRDSREPKGEANARGEDPGFVIDRSESELPLLQIYIGEPVTTRVFFRL